MTFGRYDYAAFLSFLAYASGSVVVPVALVTLADDLGFKLDEGGMTAGGALHVGRTLAMVATLALCGFLAGYAGKRKTLGWSVATMSAGVALCAIAPSYGIVFLALAIAGLGEGVIEGLATPFVQDLHPEEPGRYINFTHSFWSIGVMLTVLSSGALLAYGVPWRFIIAAVALLGLIAALVLLLPENQARRYPEHPEVQPWRTVSGYAAAIFRSRRFWLFFAAMFVAGGGEFCLTFWCASFIQLSFVDSAWAGGVGTAIFAGGMVVGRTGWGYLIHQKHLKPLIVWSALAGTVITCGIPFVTTLTGLYLLLFLSGLATAPFWPSIQSYATDRLPKMDTTMMLILLSCAGVPGCGFFTLLMGIIGDQSGGLRDAFWLVPLCYMTIAALITLESRHSS